MTSTYVLYLVYCALSGFTVGHYFSDNFAACVAIVVFNFAVGTILSARGVF